MDNILDAGIRLILFLQSIGDWIIQPMKFFTFLGDEEFFLLVTPILYWCIDTTIGIRAAVMLMFSTGIYSIGKWIFRGPRPFWISTDVKPYVFEDSFGIPSGHSQNAVTVWGIIAASFKKKWLWGVAIGLMILIGSSRVILSAHFPHDVFAGWILGILVLILFIKFEPGVIKWLRGQSTLYKIGIFFGVSLAMILIGFLILLPLRQWDLPTSWSDNAAAAFPDEDPINPLALSSEVTVAAAFFGLASGYVLLFAGSGFNPRGLWWQLVLRYLLGVVGVLIIWAGLDAVFPDGETIIAYVFRYLRYGLVGFWVTYLGPKMFLSLKLAKPSQM